MKSIGVFILILSFLFYYKPRFLFNYVVVDGIEITSRKKFGITEGKSLFSLEILVFLIVIFSYLFTKKLQEYNL